MDIELTRHQAEAMEKLQAFTRSGSSRAFVLRGFAGVGKTTLLGFYCRWLETEGYVPCLLATTGRAAKVLAGKTGFDAATVHSCIYAFEEIGGFDSGDQPGNSQLSLHFAVKEPNFPPNKLIFIVDEASMIPNTATTGGHTATFGSGHLLIDLLTYSSGQKIVFVGDPCQLPPVSEEAFSPALSPRYLHEQYRVPVAYAELSEIIRQAAQSEILRFAGYYRQGLVSDTLIKWPLLEVPQEQEVHLLPSEHQLVEAYLDFLRKGAYREAIMITHANSHCRRLNHKIRMSLRGKNELAAGELLMVVQNSYCVPLSNGDQVLVKKVAFAGKKAGFTFLAVELEDMASGDIHKTLLIRELLYNDLPGLQAEESRRLLIDFDQRMRKAKIQRNSKLYQGNMRSDPYLNALRAKFGYVITCHKAQGGEWKHVFLNLQSSVFAQPLTVKYRWLYTAITRASEHLYLNDGWWIKFFSKRQPKAAARHFKQSQAKKKS